MNTETKTPTYSQIRDLNNLALDSRMNEYAEKYNVMCVVFGADIVNTLIEQYHTGPVW